MWCKVTIRRHRWSLWPLCVNVSRLRLKITAHQMVGSSPRQPACGGEASVGFGAQTRLDRNGTVSSNETFSDSSTTRNKHWVTPWGGGGGSGFQGGIVTFGLRSGVTPHSGSQSALIWFTPPSASSSGLLHVSLTQRDCVPTLIPKRFIHSSVLLLLIPKHPSVTDGGSSSWNPAYGNTEQIKYRGFCSKRGQEALCWL